MKNLPKVDAVIIGGGWSGLLMAKELGAHTSLSVAVLERGGPRKLPDYLGGMDELEYNVRFRMMQDYSQETVTLRYNTRDRAVPIRQLGNFLPGTGTGGAGEHWGAVCPRYVDDLFQLYTKTVERYGAMVAAGLPPVGTHETLTPRQHLAERLILGLRLGDGVPAAWLEERAALGPARLPATLEAWRERGLLGESDGRVRLTEAGFLLSDALFVELL